MGTEYPLGKDLYIYEMSNKFSFYKVDKGLAIDEDDIIDILDDVSIEDFLSICIKGIKACSYWSDPDEVKEELKKLIDYIM